MEIKMVFRYEDCLEKGLLRKIPPSKENAGRSLKKADKWLEEAAEAFKSDIFNSSVLASYMTMFHAARAILFLDGFREKSHACVARYLEERYVKTGKLEKNWIELLDHYRDIRHDDQYGLTFFSTKEEAEKSLESASLFLERIKILHDFLTKPKKGEENN